MCWKVVTEINSTLYNLGVHGRLIVMWARNFQRSLQARQTNITALQIFPVNFQSLTNQVLKMRGLASWTVVKFVKAEWAG